MRVPPTERKGRVHTSTVTVAVFEGHLEPMAATALNPHDIVERVTRGTGAGGQNRNKTAPSQHTNVCVARTYVEYTSSFGYSKPVSGLEATQEL